MKLILIGHGKMGKLLEQSAAEQGDEVLAALGRDNLSQLSSLPAADMVIDFSRPETLDAVSAYIRRTGTPLLSGTTGYTPEQLERVRALGDCAPVLYAANYSLGIAVFQRVLSQISDTLKPEFDIEIEETHHNQKADAPSGTAKLLLSAIDPAGEYAPVYGREGNTGKRTKKEIGIHGPPVAGFNGAGRAALENITAGSDILPLDVRRHLACFPAHPTCTSSIERFRARILPSMTWGLLANLCLKEPSISLMKSSTSTTPVTFTMAASMF